MHSRIGEALLGNLQRAFQIRCFIMGRYYFDLIDNRAPSPIAILTTDITFLMAMLLLISGR